MLSMRHSLSLIKSRDRIRNRWEILFARLIPKVLSMNDPYVVIRSSAWATLLILSLSMSIRITIFSSSEVPGANLFGKRISFASTIRSFLLYPLSRKRHDRTCFHMSTFIRNERQNLHGTYLITLI